MFAKGSSLSSSALPKDKAELELARIMQWTVKRLSAFNSFTKGFICKIFPGFLSKLLETIYSTQFNSSSG